MRIKLVLLVLLIVAAALAYTKYFPTLKPSTLDTEKSDQIKVSNPQPGEIITSPLVIKGEARGTWFFEASFPVYLYDSNGNEVAVGYAQARSDWMTEDFVQFTATLNFELSETQNGTLILKKDNPSDMRELDDSVTIPVILSAQ